MNRLLLACGLLLSIAASGCHSGLVEQSVPLADVLAGPYALRLSVNPKSASPGEHVTVAVEFENTGTATLWIPRRQEICLSYEQDGAGNGHLPPSACDGLRFVKVSPGKTVRYENDFGVPAGNGNVKLFLLNRPDVSVPLEVKKSAPPVHPSLEPRKKDGSLPSAGR